MTENIRDTWRTPRWLFDALNEKHRFTIDAAASDENHLLPRYCTREQDALAQSWQGERVFCNPPFCRGNDLTEWLRNGIHADLAVFVLPARTDTAWFQYATEIAHLITFVVGRVNFVAPEGVKKSSNFERTVIIEIRKGGTGTSIVQAVPREWLGYKQKRKGEV